MDLNEMQKRIYQNKLDKGFNTTDINLEFCLLNGEVAEAFEAYIKKKDNLGSELADVAIYLMGLSELLGISLEDAKSLLNSECFSCVYDYFEASVTTEDEIRRICIKFTKTV